MKKKLVIIGANDFQNQLILKAKNKGMETHVFAWQDGSIGERTADYFYPISIVEKDKILEKCQEIMPDGIISIASDLATITVNYVAEKMGLVGNGIHSSQIATNKYLMRQQFEKRHDPSPLYYRSDELSEEKIAHFKFPMIVKPVDRSGSRGITKVMNETELFQAIQSAEAVSFDKKAMIEEFVDGKEYSVEYISFEGKHTFLAVTEKFTTGAPHFIETGHRQPAVLSEEILQKVKNTVEHALDTLEVKYGASHSEIKITKCGDIKIIEIGARMGGDCIGSDLVKISTGYDFVEMVIDVACGCKPKFEKICKPKNAEIRFLFNENDINQMNELKQKKPECFYRISEVENVGKEHTVTDSSTRLGYYILEGYNE